MQLVRLRPDDQDERGAMNTRVEKIEVAQIALHVLINDHTANRHTSEYFRQEAVHVEKRGIGHEAQPKPFHKPLNVILRGFNDYDVQMPNMHLRLLPI